MFLHQMQTVLLILEFMSIAFFRIAVKAHVIALVQEAQILEVVSFLSILN